MSYTKHCHLHVFADASLVAYGATAYAVGYVSSQGHLLTSTIRVPPLRSKLTIPKLEMAALAVACKLACTLCKGQWFKSITLWSDSSICLTQARSPDKQKEVFIANRADKVYQSKIPVRHADLSARTRARFL